MPAPAPLPLDPAKFCDPRVTAGGARRARVELAGLETLWFNTGTRCNIECRGCYIESSPRNDRLAFLTSAQVAGFLDEVAELGLPTRLVGFTGGEPFVNPELPEMLAESLGRGFEALVLTNGMQPMMRPRVRRSLLALGGEFDARLVLRVSLDHHTRAGHDEMRGRGSWRRALSGLHWLADGGFRVAVAGRTRHGESEAAARAGFRRLFAAERLRLDADDPHQLVLFPELDATLDVAEITVDCWAALGLEPSAVMCAKSRMVLLRRGEVRPAVVSCTLLPYDSRFEMGRTLADALGTVPLNHPHCARFCVLGGGSCSVG